jgi:S-adenosylmethionine:tRNA ribosyltransferase-isomerase
MNLSPDLLTSSYNYVLPEELIAEKPAEPRDTSKLLVINRESGLSEDKSFKDITEYLNEGDILVLNNTRVLPARLYGRKNYEGALVEVFLVRELEKDSWLTLAKPAKRLKIDTLIAFEHSLEGKVTDILDGGERIIKFTYPPGKTFLEIIGLLGEVPFPPYIKKPACGPERYQTIYSEKEGSVAAPTAGLHFTEELLATLQKKGVNLAYITLHIGLGTFQPLKTENIKEHNMHSEYYELSAETAALLNRQKQAGKRIIAVGTTVTRVLETVFNNYGSFQESSGDSNIFIYPGYRFKAVDCLITNFHLPESTLLMLVSAFWERKKLLEIYEYAKKSGYKFYSLGDAMFLH